MLNPTPCPVALEADDAATGEHWLDAGHPELSRLLDYQVHPLAATDPLQEQDGDGRFRARIDCPPNRNPNVGTANGSDGRIMLVAPPVEHADPVALPETQDSGDVSSGLLAQPDLAAGHEGGVRVNPGGPRHADGADQSGGSSSTKR